MFGPAVGRILGLSMRTCIVSLTLAGTLASAFAFAAADHRAEQGTLEQRLMGRYKLSDSNPSRTTAGSLVILTKAGFECSPYGQIMPSATWDHGRVKSSALKKSFLTNSMPGLVRIPLDVGTRLYVTKIEAKDTYVNFEVAVAQAVEGVYYRSSIHFEFGKTYLDSLDFATIERTIADVLEIEQQGGGRGGARPASTPTPQQPQVFPDTPPPPPPPPTVGGSPAAPSQGAVQIQPGMSVAEVQSALGKPDKITKFGAKEVQLFGKLKVTFLNGKVSDIE